MSGSKNVLRTAGLIAVATAIAIGASGSVANAANVLDTSFGKRGWHRLPADTEARGVALSGMVQLSDGGLRVFGQVDGDLGVFAYRSDGSSDKNFYSRGWRLLEPVWRHGADWDMPMAAVRHGEDHTIVAGGIDYVSAYATYRQQTISRIGDDGRLDHDFGDHGTVRIARLGLAIDVAVDSRQRVVTISRVNQRGGSGSGRPIIPPKTEITRYLPDGRLDRSFGNDGTVVRTAPGGSQAVAVEVDSKDRILSLSWDNTGTKKEPDRQATLARYREDGKPDSGYGENGTADPAVTGYLRPDDFLLLTDDRTLMSGTRGDGGDLALVSNFPTGGLDVQFGEGGIRSDYSAQGWRALDDLTLLESGNVAGMHGRRLTVFQPDGSPVAITGDGLPQGVIAAGEDGSVFTAGASLKRPAVGRIRPDHTVDQDFTQNSLPQEEILTNQPRGLLGLGKLSDGSLAGALEVGSSKYYDNPGIFHLSNSGKSDPLFGDNGLVPVDQRFSSPVRIVSAPRGKVRVLGAGPGSRRAFRYDITRSGRTSKADLGSVRQREYTDSVATRDGGFVTLSDAVRKKRGERSIVGFALNRFLASGRPARFGNGGQARTFFGLDASPSAAIEDRRGRIVVAGGNCSSEYRCVESGKVSQKVTFARFLKNGRLDRSFGNGGKVQHAFRTQGAAWGLNLLPDGRIVALVGNVCNWNCFNRFALMSIRSDGSLDRRFGGDGRVIMDIGRKLDPTKLFPAGRSGVDLVATVDPCRGEPSFGVLRFRRDGRLDRRFGGGDGLLRALPGGALEAKPYLAVKQSRGTITMGGPIDVPGRFGGVEATSGIARIRLSAKDGKENLRTCPA